ncbi:ABC transporter substrate-binding protein [Hansschlegelia plantiphila]|uniref:ABC transporter substrate-binding protein n=1 Tax=Hansschlegelia plantiphila TaxID=374655 RepID=A0A9W6J2C9_9HYPH|nr:ABC transporter substrate-binding protein [Hansschlegelia plantiphila]GLK69052.1 ABC transporter substrate-binding protein [Hansschlegelia plantiphila]
MRLGARLAGSLIATALIGISSSAWAEGTIRIAEQYGIGYLPLHVIRDQKLIEKHGKELGLDIQVEWAKFGGGATVNDALLSGSVDIAAAGVGPTLTIWDRTKGGADVKGIASLGSMPSYLVTNKENVKALKDFTKDDKIALPSVGVSVQARTLQIAVEKEFGVGNHKALDDIQVSLAHPDAVAALNSGAITAHFTTPPFQYQELQNPKNHKVLSSYDVLGGPATTNIAYGTTKFRTENPKTYKAFFEALKEATDWINAHKEEAVDTYIRVEKSKLDRAFLLSIVTNPEIEFKIAPERTEVYADFLARTGAIRNKPASWKDYFFEDVQAVEGS